MSNPIQFKFRTFDTLEYDYIQQQTVYNYLLLRTKPIKRVILNLTASRTNVARSSKHQTSTIHFHSYIFIIEVTNLTFTHCKLCVKNRGRRLQFSSFARIFTFYQNILNYI